MRRSSFISRWSALRLSRRWPSRRSPMGIGQAQPRKSAWPSPCPPPGRRSTAHPIRQSPASASTRPPSTAPSTPPAWPPGTAASQRYRRVHSRPQLAASSSTSPAQNHQAGMDGDSSASGPRRLRASRASQARAPTSNSHQAEWPNRNSARSEAQAPSSPAQLATGAPVPEVEKPGSVARWLARASSISSHSTPPANSSSCGRQRGRSAASAERCAASVCAPSRCSDPRGKVIRRIVAQAGLRTGWPTQAAARVP
jgi:hypothetical protein